jgi:Ion channel
MSFTTIAGVILLIAVLLDAFETIVLPRRVRRHFRLTTWLYYTTWIPWAKIAHKIKKQARRESFLGYFGPLSLILLLVLWAGCLIFSFALIQYGAGEHLQLGHETVNFGSILYQSGETFFTLGYGDIIPTNGVARALSVIEAGMGFAFLGVVVGYLPTIYSAFSRREIEISLLDARAGSPPTAAELLARYGKHPDQAVLDRIFHDWERWSAEVLESHLSYPALSFFRSQHNNQSWLGALTTILDATSLVMTGIENIRPDQARLTFAMARHAVVDLAQVVSARYDPDLPDRLPSPELARLFDLLHQRGLRPKEGPDAEHDLAQLRARYEPYAQGIAKNLLITLPPWIHPEKKKDNWEAGPWDRIIQARSLGRIAHRIRRMDDHF